VAPTGVDADEWGTVAHRVQMLLQLYIHPDLFSVVNNDTLYPTVYNKWVHLGAIHGGESGSTVVFNQWTILVDSRLDDTQPLAPQFAKLNEATSVKKVGVPAALEQPERLLFLQM